MAAAFLINLRLTSIGDIWVIEYHKSVINEIFEESFILLGCHNFVFFLWRK